VNVLTSDGKVFESYRYSPYGVPYGMPCGDVDGDGDVDSSDQSALSTAIGGSYDVHYDLNLDGVLNSSDETRRALFAGETSGRESLSIDPTTVIGGGSGGTRFGYGAQPFDRFTNKWHMRSKVLDPDSGRWLQRDLGRPTSPSEQYAYASLNPE